MKDGHSYYCKDCCHKYQSEYRKNHINSKKTKPSTSSHKKWNAKYRKRFPEKYIAQNSIRIYKDHDGFNNHHWSYNNEHRNDVIVLKIEDHLILHRYMIYDQERMMYRTINGILLDTKERHIEYLKTLVTEVI